VSIDQRPAIIDDRSHVGDWEADTIIGKAHKQAIVSLTEKNPDLHLFVKWIGEQRKTPRVR
jgi:IS30 family transposase